MTEIETLAAELAKITETRDTFAGRLPGKEAALAAARDHRQNLLEQTARGVDLSAKVLKDAGLALAAAEEGLALLREQIAATASIYDLAKTAHDEAVQAGRLEAVALAKRAVIAAGDRLAHHGGALTGAAAELTDAYGALFSAMHTAGVRPADHEIQGLQGLKIRIPSAVPADFQNWIIAGGAPRVMHVGQFERSLWLDGAAADPEADAPYNEAARVFAEKITAQQAFEALGRTEAEKRLSKGFPAFAPTDAAPQGRQHRS